MKIAICDDSVQDAEHLHGMLMSNCGKQVHADIFVLGNELLSAIQSGVHYDALFLDIDMPTPNGLELARMIKKQVPQTILIFVTSYPQYALDAFDCEAFHYLLKPVAPEKAAKIMERLIRNYQEHSHFHIIKIRRETIRLPIKKILYVECCQRHIIYHTANAAYETVGNLKKVYHELRQYGFLQIHQGYLVNMGHIDHFDDYDVILSNTKPVPMSVRKRGEVLSAYARYIEVH